MQAERSSIKTQAVRGSIWVWHLGDSVERTLSRDLETQAAMEWSSREPGRAPGRLALQPERAVGRAACLAATPKTLSAALGGLFVCQPLSLPPPLPHHVRFSLFLDL